MKHIVSYGKFAYGDSRNNGFVSQTPIGLSLKLSIMVITGRGEICIRVNLSTGQWVYLYTVFSNFRVQNRGEICIHKRSKQEWNLYTKVEGKGCICILYFINLKDFFRVKAKVIFVYFCQISDEICIQKFKAKEIFVYSISSIWRIFLGSKQRLLLYTFVKSVMKFVYSW